MRRSDKMIQDPAEIEDILNKAEVCRIGMCQNDLPYIVPVIFFYEEGRIYFHSATEGKKVEWIRIDPRVCFEVEDGVEIVSGRIDCDWGVKYRSVIGEGTASIIDNHPEKIRVLDILVRKYAAKSSEISPEKVEKTVVIMIEIDRMTGKKSG